MSKLKAKSPDVRRLLKKVIKQEDGCWIWAGSTQPNGYGQAFLDGQLTSAHRAMYMATHQVKLCRREFVCHRCDVANCVNPDHMFIGSTQDNMDDMVAKGRHGSRKQGKEWGAWNRGAKSHLTKLTDEQVVQIKALLAQGVKCGVIAEQFPITRSGVSKIKHNNAWKHIPN